MEVLLALLSIFTVFVHGQNIVRVSGDKNSKRSGRVEIFQGGRWGYICDDGWDVKDAAVVCRMLGFNAEYVQPLYNTNMVGLGFTPPVPGTPVLITEVECSGDERTIADCPRSNNGANCNINEASGVICYGEEVTTTTTTPIPTTTTTQPPRICNNPSPNVRLLDGPNEASGRVQLLRQGIWSEVCDDGWGENDAKVICRMLCYNPANARAHIGGTFGNATEDNTPVFWMDDVECNGNEADIGNCAFAGWGVHKCEITEAAGVSCMIDEPTPQPLPDPVIDCDGEVIKAKFSRAAEPRLKPEHLSLTVPGNVNCLVETDQDAFWVWIAIPFIGCGTTRTDNDTDMIYANSIQHKVPPESSVITRTEVYQIPVSCVYGRNGDPDNELKPEGRTPGPQVGDGHFELRLNLYETSKFEKAIAEFPAKVLLGDWVYVGMSLISTDVDLKLVVPQCFATPELDPTSTPQYYFLRDKCTQEPTYTAYPKNNTFYGFRFQAFKFVSELQEFEYVYLHCKGIVCPKNEKSNVCDRTCNLDGAGKRKKRETYVYGKDGYEKQEQSPSIFQSFVSLFRSKRQAIDTGEMIGDKIVYRADLAGALLFTKKGEDNSGIENEAGDKENTPNDEVRQERPPKESNQQAGQNNPQNVQEKLTGSAPNMPMVHVIATVIIMLFLTILMH